MKFPISILILISFLINSVAGPLPAAYAYDFHLPAPGVRVGLSPEFSPAILKGITVHPKNPFQFDFIVDQGDSRIPSDQKKSAYQKLVKYFLASLTTPEKDLWVNLSPYEKNRIIPDTFGKTEMGRDLLAQDYILKQITASLIYPEEEFGKRFWKKVYAQAAKEFGTTDIPVNTFNKVWIIPDQATVYEFGNTAYVLKSHLKVMLEEDYLSLEKHTALSFSKTHAIGSQVVREIVLPQLEKEVNEGKNFALLRQVNNSLILATWFKKRLKQSVLGRIYVDRGKVRGVDQDPRNNEAIYRQYLKAYKKGVFNYIKEDYDTLSQQTVPRKYFSGGYSTFMQGPEGKTDLAQRVEVINSKNISPEDGATLADEVQNTNTKDDVRINLENPDHAMKTATLKIDANAATRQFLKATEGIETVAANSSEGFDRLHQAYAALRQLESEGVITDAQRGQVEPRRFIDQVDMQKAEVLVRQGKLDETSNYYGGAEMADYMTVIRMIENSQLKESDLILRYQSIHGISYKNVPQIYYERRRIEAARDRKEITPQEAERAIKGVLAIETIKWLFKTGQIDQIERDRRMNDPEVLRGTYWTALHDHPERTIEDGRASHNDLIGRFRSDSLDELRYVYSEVIPEGVALELRDKGDTVFTLGELRKLTRNNNFGNFGADGQLDYRNLNPYIFVKEGSVKPYVDTAHPLIWAYDPAKKGSNYDKPAFVAYITYAPVNQVGNLVERAFNEYDQEMEKAKNILGQLTAIMTLYQKLVMIHPYLDGNGRAARLLVDSLLNDLGLPPMLYPDVDDILSSREELVKFAFESMASYVATYRGLINRASNEGPEDTPLSIPSVPYVSPDKAKEDTTRIGHERYPTEPNVTTVVLARQGRKLIFVRQANGQLSLPERYALGGENAWDTAKAFFESSEAGHIEAGRIKFSAQLGFEGKPGRTTGAYRYSAIAFADIQGELGGNLVAVDPDSLDINSVIPEDRDIVQKSLDGSDFMARNPMESRIVIANLKDRTVDQRTVNEERAKKTQDIHADIMAGGHVSPSVAPDTVTEVYDKNSGQFLGIQVEIREGDGHLATPGGHANQQESPEHAAIREAFEETGLTGIQIVRLLKVATRADRDDRKYIWSPLYLARVYGGRAQAGSDATATKVLFRTRDEFDKFLLDKMNWVRQGVEKDRLTPEQESILDDIIAQRDRDGRISKENYDQLQQLAQNRRANKQYGLFWADHLEHLVTYFDYKEEEVLKVKKAEQAINSAVSQITIDFDALFIPGTEKIDYDILKSIKKLMALEDHPMNITVVMPSENGMALRKLVLNELSKMLVQEGKAERTGLVQFVPASEVKADKNTVNLSRKIGTVTNTIENLFLDKKGSEHGGVFDITSLGGFLRWLGFSREMGMVDKNGLVFDYAKAIEIINAGANLRLYKLYAHMAPSQLHAVLEGQYQQLLGYLIDRRILSDMHIHPTGSATSGFVLEMAYRSLNTPGFNEENWNKTWGWVDREFSKNLDDLGYSSFRELVEALDLDAMQYLIGTPHKEDNKTLVEYFERYGIIQNVNENEKTTEQIARDTAEQEFKRGVRLTELRFATSSSKNEELVQTAYLPNSIARLNEKQLNFLKSLPSNHEFLKVYQYENGVYVRKVAENEVPPSERPEIYQVMRIVNLIGMETLSNIMANRRGLEKAKQDYAGSDYRMVMILPKLDSVDMMRTIIQEIGTLKKITRQLKHMGVEKFDERQVGAAVDEVLGKGSVEREYWIGVFWNQCRKDSLKDIISSLDAVVGFDTAGPEFLFYKDIPQYLADFYAEFENQFTDDEKIFLKTVAYRGNWLDKNLDAANMERLRQILAKVHYAGRVRFMAKRLQGIMDVQTEAKDLSGQRLFRESTSHTGEAYASLEEGLSAVQEAVEYLGVKRIGHGIAVGIDPNELLGTYDGYGKLYDAGRVGRLVAKQKEVMQELIDKDIAIEINVSSNMQTSGELQTGNSPDLMKHPFFRLLAAGVPLVIGTDGLLVSNTTLADEVVKLGMAFNLSQDDIRKWIDKIASRLGTISIPRILRNHDYQMVIDKVDPMERISLINHIKMLMTFVGDQEGPDTSISGSQAAEWLKNVAVPLDIFAMQFYVISQLEVTIKKTKKLEDRRIYKEALAQWGKVLNEFHWDQGAFDRARDLTVRIAQGESGSLEEFRSLDKKSQDFVLLMIFSKMIGRSEYNLLKEQVAFFVAVKQALLDTSDNSHNLSEILNTTDGMWLQRLFSDEGGANSAVQVRAPPAAISHEARRVEVVLDIRGPIDAGAIKAFLVNWRQSKNVISIKIRVPALETNPPNLDTIKSALADPYEGFFAKPEDVPVISDENSEAGDILVTDNTSLAGSRKNVLLLTPQPDGKYVYSFDGAKVEGDAIGASINRSAFAVTGRIKTMDELDTILDGREVVAVTGFTMQKFDKTKAKSSLKTLLKTLNPKTTALVMGTNESGFDEVLLQAVKENFEENGRKNKFLVIGAMPQEGFQYSMGNVDDLIVQGKTWPEDTPVFLKRAKVIYRLGGGPFARDRTNRAAPLEIPTFVPAGYGEGSTQYSVWTESDRRLLAASMHRAVFADRLMDLDGMMHSPYFNGGYNRVLIGDSEKFDHDRQDDVLSRAAKAKSDGKKLVVFYDGTNEQAGDALWHMAAEEGSVILPVAVVGKNGFYNQITESTAILYEEKMPIGELMGRLAKDGRVVKSGIVNTTRDYQSTEVFAEPAVDIPQLAGVREIALPTDDETAYALKSVKGKMLVRIIGGSPDMTGWSDQIRASYYGRLSMFFDDLLGLYTSKDRVAIMIDINDDVFQQEIIKVAAEKGVDIIGVVSESGPALDVSTIPNAADRVHLVKRSSALWDHVNASIILGGNINNRQEHTDTLDARLTPQRRAASIMIAGFGDGKNALTDRYSKDNDQPNIPDARMAISYLQSRLPIWIINNIQDRAKALKAANNLKLELAPYIIPLAWARNNTSLDGYDPEDALKNLQKEDIEVGFLMGQRNFGWEGGSLGEHTSKVANNFENLIRRVMDILPEKEQEELKALLPALRMGILLHDIGKPISHDNQYQETLKILERKFNQWGFSQQQLAVVKALIMGDPFGQLSLPFSSAEPQKLFDDVENNAKGLGIAPELFYALRTAYYMADASSYKAVITAGFVQGADGKLLLKKDFGKISELLGLFGGNIASEFMTSQKVDDDNILPSAVRDYRFSAVGQDGVKPAFSWMMGIETSSFQKALSVLARDNFTRRIGVNTRGLDEEGMLKIVDHLKGEASEDKTIPGRSILVVTSDDVNVLAQFRKIAHDQGWAFMPVIGHSILDPSRDLSIPRGDYWYISQDNDEKEQAEFINTVCNLQIGVSQSGEIIESKNNLNSGSDLRNGGIDLNPANQNMVIQGKGNDFILTPGQLKNLNAAQVSGFVPIVISIRPIQDLSKVLGIN